MNMLKKRSRGYTSVSVLITVLVLALVMLLNTVFSVLAAHYSLFVDLTDTELWTLSDEAKKVIAEADGDITITFCHEKDYIESSDTMKYISGTAEEIAKAFPNVHVRYVNSILEPKLFEKYKYTDVSTIKTTSVIVESGSGRLLRDRLEHEQRLGVQRRGDLRRRLPRGDRRRNTAGLLHHGTRRERGRRLHQHDHQGRL